MGEGEYTVSGARLRGIKKGKKKGFLLEVYARGTWIPTRTVWKRISKVVLRPRKYRRFRQVCFSREPTDRVCRVCTGKITIVITNSDDEQQLREKNSP